MLGQDTGDMIVDDNHFIALVPPLLGEHADRRRAAADPHALLEFATNDRRLAGLHDHARAAVNDKLDAPAVAKIEQSVAGHAALFLAAVGEVIDAAEREHLRTIFAGRHMADWLAFGAHNCAFRAEMAIGVDFELHAAIAVDALGDHRHHVDPIDLGGNDEGGGLIVGVGGAGADSGDEWTGSPEDVAAPGSLSIDEWHDLAAFVYGPVEQHMRVGPHQLAILVRVTVARSRHPGPNVAHDGTGVAADLVVGLGHACVLAASRIAWRTRSGVAGARRMRTPIA